MKVFALTCEELAREMKVRWGKGMYHAAALYREVFKKGSLFLANAHEFASSPDLIRRIEDALHLPSCRIVVQKQDDEALKFVTSMADGSLVESVLIPSPNRTTLCVSSQVGCRMGCRFCTTGSMGFVRHLEVEEIVWQVYAARFELQRPVHNIVFMGMGEPLDNLDNVVQAIRVLSDQRGFDIPPRRITLSTAGHADGIERLGALQPGNLRLAVSLNAPNNELRSKIMPINRRFPLERLKESLLAYPPGRDGVIFVEYVLLENINDSWEHARELARYLRGLGARVNVIACNDDGASIYKAPSPEKVRQFCNRLADEGLFVRERRSRGSRIMAGCGQLGATRAR